ncbi:hypothetical protein VWY73_12475 [Phaeobacter sp. JH20_12]|uniref:hypothetical protein n=2 Tax=unclassified Phaeobacter TaxID=2621772 RepID=UPI003A88274E
MADEGKKVRVAMNGPDIEHDQLIGKIAEFNAEDGKRASSAGETRQQIGQFLDSTSLNSKAFAWLRQIMKTNDKADGQAKAMDIIRSLNTGLPMVEAFVAGQGSGEMNLEGPSEAPEEAPDNAPDEQSEPEDPETAEFNAEVDEAMGDDTVVPFGQGEGETPIDFDQGGAA